jgi:serine/threonine-protein phosphatase 6 regulatory ankyrin repeat subunit B
VVEELLASKPDIDARRTTDNWSALMIAVDEGQLPVAARLLGAGADPNAVSRFGETPLMLAISAGNTAMADLLRNHRATDGEAAGQLFVAARRGNAAEMTRLLDAHTPADMVDRRGRTPLLAAVRADHRDVAALLIKAGAEVDRRTSAGTPLENAVRGGSLQMVKELISLDAKPDVPGRGGKTPLLLACERNHPKIAGHLLEKNADPNAADDAGRTPLLIAMLERNVATVKRLKTHGATAGAIEAELMLVAEKDNEPRVTALLER